MRTFPLARTYDPNSVLQAAYRRFFEHIEIDEAWLRIVREAAERGPVVYVLRNLSFLDFVALDYITKTHGLPEVRFANDLGLWLLEPFGETWREALRPSARETPEQRLSTVIESGGSAALFLKRPPTFLEKTIGNRKRYVSTEGDNLVRTLFELQRHIDRPIMLVPQVFVWSKRPTSLQGSWVDFIFGPREWPGTMRIAAQFLLNYKHVLLRAGEPMSLLDFMKSNQGEGDDTLVRRGTYALIRKIERERRAIVGPIRKPADRVRDEIIRSPKLQSTIKHLAGDGSAERMVLTARAYATLRQMEASPDPETIRGLTAAFEGVLNRVYAGVEIDKEGLERVRQAAQLGTIVLLPSHKSHMDYLLLSYVLYENSLQLPLIAAGDNLSFFPVGAILRRGGGFFIRRSFKGDRLYVAVVDAYLRRLVKDGWPIEFFLEGARSRTGKLLAPKLGLLNMLVDSAVGLPNREVFFVPVSIGYERLLEEGSYVRELLGGEKKKESTAGLIRALGILAERYGRLNVQFGEILSLSQAAEEVGWKRESKPPPAKRRELTTRIAYRVMAEINKSTAVTPGSVVALALLTHGRRGVVHTELVARVQRLAAVLRLLGARMTPSLATSTGVVRPTCVGDAIEMFRGANLVEVHVPGESLQSGAKSAKAPTGDDAIYTVPENKRLALDLSKNIILHFFVPAALGSAAILAPPGPPISRTVVRERVQRLSRLFKYEFMFRADASFEKIFDDTLQQMLDRGELVLEAGDHLGLGEGHDGLDGRGWIVLYASMVRNFVESYRVAARSLSLLLKGPMAHKELARRALAIGDRMYLAGDIERREALSRTCLDNALQSLLDQGYLEPLEDKKIALASSFNDAEAVRAIEGRIANYLPRRADDRA
jgi:glycerol-3-phosphate O-acyltransferase